MPSVFIVGATGYIGGALLVALNKAHPDLDITALVRSESHLEAIRSAGATPVQGTSQEVDKIADLSSKADVVINMASSDDVQLNSAILRGIKQRMFDGNGKGTLIHTSGTAIFLDGSKSGNFVADGKVWNDNVEEDIKALTTDMWHGPVDVPILEAGEEGYVYTYIICPSAVYGPGSGPVGRNSGLHKALVGNALQLKYSPYFGEGSAVFPTVHIDDLISLYLIVFNLAISGPPKSSPYARYFIGGVGSTTAKSISSALAKALHARGRLDSPEPKNVATVEEAGFMAPFIASNAFTRSDRSLGLGWIPKATVSLEVAMVDDIDRVLADMPV